MVNTCKREVRGLLHIPGKYWTECTCMHMERTGENFVLTLEAPGQMHVEMSVSSGVSCTSAQILEREKGGKFREGRGREGKQ